MSWDGSQCVEPQISATTFEWPRRRSMIYNRWMRLLVALVVVASTAGAARGDDAAPVYRASVELADTNGAVHAIVTTKLVCGRPAKCPAWTLDLGPADDTELVALVDLLGQPTHLRNGDALANRTGTLPGSAKLPAAFVRTKATDAARNRWERWAIVSLVDGRPKLIWRGEIAMTPEKGGGFSTNDGVELVATELDKPLALVFVQTAIPKPNEKAHPPSKLVSRRFVFKDGAYQRE